MRRAARTALVAALVGAAASASGSSAASAPALLTDPVDVPAGALDLVAVTFGQLHERLLLRLTTAAEWTGADLSAAPGRSICVQLFHGALPSPRARICVEERRDATLGLRYTRLGRGGQALGGHALPAAVSRPDARSLLASFAPAAVGLHEGGYSWRAQTTWRDSAACLTAGACTDLAPDSGAVPVQIVAPRAVQPGGCVAGGPTQRRSGPRNARVVALTFDDGPSRYTPQILGALEHAKVPATFFEVGKQVPGHRALLRRILRDGSMLGDHTLTHADVAGGGAFAAGQIATTRAIIQRESGFAPCLFRPPYGATSPALTEVVRSLGALSILWDVDPRDWSTPGTAAIVATVVHEARPGSIILLHDGGGPRGQTVAALPSIIAALQRRHLRLVTVGEMLHLRALTAPPAA